MRIRARDSVFAGIAILLTSFVSGCSQSNSSQTVPTAAVAPVPAHAEPPKPAPSQTVKASYYGDEFRGRRTASGERYDPDQLTAASKKLPLGSLVHVTNPDNGRSVVVRINDHGPYVRGRSLDLSKAAARRIGLTHKGVGRVRIKRIHARPKSEAAALPEEAKAAEPGDTPAPVQRKPDDTAASTSQPAKPESAAAVPASESPGTVDAATLPPPPSESADAVQ